MAKKPRRVLAPLVARLPITVDDKSAPTLLGAGFMEYRLARREINCLKEIAARGWTKCHSDIFKYWFIKDGIILHSIEGHRLDPLAYFLAAKLETREALQLHLEVHRENLQVMSALDAAYCAGAADAADQVYHEYKIGRKQTTKSWDLAFERAFKTWNAESKSRRGKPRWSVILPIIKKSFNKGGQSDRSDRRIQNLWNQWWKKSHGKLNV